MVKKDVAIRLFVGSPFPLIKGERRTKKGDGEKKSA